jgi:flagellar protein FliO/FliZ
MDWMLYLRAMAALLVVLGLMVGCMVLLRRYGHKLNITAVSTGKSRIAVLETKLIDARSKLVLVRRDGAEHLLLVSATGSCVVEANIKPDIKADAV